MQEEVVDRYGSLSTRHQQPSAYHGAECIEQRHPETAEHQHRLGYHISG
jgi:hypothetical protein